MAEARAVLAGSNAPEQAGSVTLVVREPPTLPREEFMPKPGARRRRTCARSRRLFFEPLEDRSLLAAVITVNSTLDTDARDSFLTLREAILINNRTLAVASLTTDEQAQVV